MLFHDKTNGDNFLISVFVKLSFFLFFIFFFSFLPIKTYAATYYVDNTCSNNGDGSSQTCALSPGATGPFNSIANMQIKSGGYSQDDQIQLKKGKIFRETLTPPSSGSTGHPITFGAYGSGASPIINGADLLASSWTQLTESGGLFLSGFENNSPSNFSDWTSYTHNGSATMVPDTSTYNHATTSAKLTGDGTDNRAYLQKKNLLFWNI